MCPHDTLLINNVCLLQVLRLVIDLKRQSR